VHDFELNRVRPRSDSRDAVACVALCCTVCCRGKTCDNFLSLEGQSTKMSSKNKFQTRKLYCRTQLCHSVTHSVAIVLNETDALGGVSRSPQCTIVWFLKWRTNSIVQQHQSNHGHGNVYTYSFLYDRPLSARTLSTSSRSSMKNSQRKCRYGTSVILVKSVVELNYVTARPWLWTQPKTRVGYLAGCMHVYRYIYVYIHMLMRMHTHIFMHI